jgi:hypothetical protein
LAVATASQGGPFRTNTLAERRHAHVVRASSAVEINGMRIEARDGAAIEVVAAVRIAAIADSELVMVDAP